MATVARWLPALGVPLCARTTTGAFVCKNHASHCKFSSKRRCSSFHCCFGRRWSGQRGNAIGRIGDFDDSEPELLMTGDANNLNAFGALALLLSDGEEEDDDTSIISAPASLSREMNLASASGDSNELYEKLAENGMNGDLAGGAVEDKDKPEGVSNGEQAHLEIQTRPEEARFATSPYQHANNLLEEVNRSLDGLEFGLVRHAEELEATALSENLSFSGVVDEAAVGTLQPVMLNSSEVVQDIAEEERKSENSESQSVEMDLLREEIMSRDILLDLLRKEATEAAQSLKAATQTMLAAKRKINHLQEQLQQEVGATQNALDLFSGSLMALSVADEKLKEVERQIELVTVASQQEREYFAEITSLKGLVETKENMMQAMREEARRNANLLLSAAKTRDGLANAEKRVELLSAQVATLEEEVRSRDMLLQDVKNEMVRSTDALKLAAQIKQDLNASKQQVLVLNQELEGQREIVKELQQELAENHRAIRAEQAVQQMEKNLNELSVEVEMLRDGVEARDEALSFMREEVDRSIDLLSNAAENREGEQAVRQLTSYIEELRVETASKDDIIAALRTELALGETGLQVDRHASESTGETATFQSPSTPPSLEAGKPKGRSIRRRQGNSTRKPSQS